MAKKKNLKSHVTDKQNKKKLGGYWKGGKKKQYTYEGQQYRGGRKEKTPNLVKLDDGNIQNMHGVVFTPEEKKALEREANKVNAKRKRMLDEEAKLPRMKGGKETGDSVKSLQLMGKESDFILSRRSKSLQRFKSREQYEHYMENLQKINSPTYVDDRIRMYKRNHMKALENVYGDDAKDVIMKIRMMKPKDYMEYVQKDEDLEISYIYDPSQRHKRLNAMRQALGMNLKDAPIDDEFIDE